MTEGSERSLIEHVWVFSGDGSSFPGGVFSSEDAARTWIAKHRLSGTLTRYPLDEGVYDWTLRMGYFAKKPWHQTPSFIETFSSAYLEHFHFSEGSDS